MSIASRRSFRECRKSEGRGGNIKEKFVNADTVVVCI